MKRLFFLSIFATISFSLLAENVLPKDFLGLTLGKTSKNEVINIMKSNGFELIAKDDVSTTDAQYQFEGVYNHEGVEFHRIITSFVDDTLWIFSTQSYNYKENIEEVSKTLQANLAQKYGSLKTADSSLILSFFKDTIEHYGAKIWSRTDDHTTVIAMTVEFVLTCMYADMDYYYNSLWRGLAQLGELINKLPDYAEENKVLSVAGVKFGDSKENVKRVISSKSARILSEDSYSLTYKDTKVGGRTYDYATFYFKTGQGLVSANLQSAFYEWRKEEALMCFEGIKSQYSGKYTNFKILKDDEEDKICSCGAFTDGYEYKPISISFSKGLSKGGDIMYYVQVDYYYFSRENLYNDEI